MVRHFDAIVVGSGLGGLTAAALYGRAGARVLVLERSDVCGGAATVYRHGPLAIEVSLHEIDGLDDDDPKLDEAARAWVKQRATTGSDLHCRAWALDGKTNWQSALLTGDPRCRSSRNTYGAPGHPCGVQISSRPTSRASQPRESPYCYSPCWLT